MFPARLIITSVVSVLIAGTIPLLFQKSLNNFLMGFFRDIARIKARNRRMKSDSLISIGDIKSIIFDEEDDPLQDVVEQIMLGDGFTRRQETDLAVNEQFTDDLPVYTREELYEFGNGDSETLLLSIFGRIYDVTSGRKFYGKGAKYHILAGRDATRALATACLKEECLGPITSSDHQVNNQVFELDEKSIKEGKKWLAFFETHDSYKHVGFLKDGDSMEHLIDAIVEREAAIGQL
jgi:predicted heme/steroid binding protein